MDRLLPGIIISNSSLEGEQMYLHPWWFWNSCRFIHIVFRRVCIIFFSIELTELANCKWRIKGFSHIHQQYLPLFFSHASCISSLQFLVQLSFAFELSIAYILPTFVNRVQFDYIASSTLINTSVSACPDRRFLLRPN